MATDVNRRAAPGEPPPFSYRAVMDAAGDAVVIRPDPSREGGLGVSNFVWMVEKNGNATFTLQVLIGGDWETDDRVPAGDIPDKVHHHNTPFEALRITQSTLGSDDGVVRITSEWRLQVGAA